MLSSNHIRFAASLIIAIALFFTSSAHADDKLVVHEWGTFTALQDEHGDALPGINIDDEPLPEFCHNLNPWVIERPRSLPRVLMKGAPQRHPYVTMRLETPVIYFHPPKSQSLPFSIDVHVSMHGGWLTEFYPQARPDAPGLGEDFDFGPIDATTVGSLTWRGVRVGGSPALQATDRNVWLAPRKVEAAAVVVPPQTDRDKTDEAERFLFYRGVANRPAPIRATMDESAHRLSLAGQVGDILPAGASVHFAALWLVHIRRDGAVAWRKLAPMNVTAGNTSAVATAATDFADRDYSAAHLDTLSQSMHAALVADGLFDDEATAMLQTWRHAYFQSPGLRLFYLVPRAWTDAVLPLTLSRPADIHRVMMGRLELTSPEQRQLLKKLSTLRVSDSSWTRNIPNTPAGQMFWEGRSDFGDLGIAIPPEYQAYLDLGRFRNALVLAEAKARPTPQLRAFIEAYGLLPFEVK